MHTFGSLINDGGTATQLPQSGFAFEAAVLFAFPRSLEAAVRIALANQADVVIIRAGTDEEILNRLTLLLGGAMASRAFSTLRVIQINATKQHSYAESARPHLPHTDGTFEIMPPHRFILQTVETDSHGGGVSLFLGIRSVLSGIPATHLDALVTALVQFRRRDDHGEEDAAVDTILYLRPDGTVGFRWRNDTEVFPEVVDSRGTLIAKAIEWVSQRIAMLEPAAYAAAAGDLLIVNNDAVLHGRTALHPQSRRCLRRVWL